MNFNKIALGVFLSAVMLAGGNSAASAQSGRFVMEKTENGYVRMDTQSGTMSICETANGQIVCKMAADERSAFDADIAALEDRIAALEAKIDGGAGIVATDKNALPSEEEFERGLSYMEKFMRRFMGIAKELDTDPSRGASGSKLDA
ncbi:MAG: hypothetical protein U5K75_08835 [Ahrensia sp.]|nr:hypothetical protein [Ahrensia sp.]